MMDIDFLIICVLPFLAWLLCLFAFIREMRQRKEPTFYDYFQERIIETTERLLDEAEKEGGS